MYHGPLAYLTSSPKPEPYVLVQTGSIWTAMPADADVFRVL